MTDAPTMMYFGCYGDTGHYLWDKSLNRVSMKLCPVGVDIDTGLAPKGSGYQVQGEAAIHHVPGWTIISFWDRSVDDRYASNSAFLLQGKHEFDEILAKAKEEFPKVFERLTFQVRLAPGSSPPRP